jgi:ADP compounds hydrolase
MSRTIFQHQWLTVLEDDHAITYLQWADGACCVALNEKGEVLLITEYSAAFGEEVLTLPGGGLAPGENPIETANRELQEEIGFKAGRLDFLGTVQPLSKYLRVHIHLYLARDLQPSHLQGDETWDITIQPTPLDSFETLMSTGKLRDSNVIAALYMARAFLQNEKPRSLASD